MTISLPTSHLDYFGKSGISIADPGTLVSDRTSLETAHAVFSIPRANYNTLEAATTIGTAHPYFTWLAMEKRELSFQGAWCIAKCSYAGISTAFSGGTPPVYELVVGLSEEPIETHPRFVTHIGGKPDAPLNGAMFEHLTTGFIARAASPAPTGENSGYVFKAFEVLIDDALNTYAKIESYLEASEMTWKKTYNVLAHPSSVASAGKIDSPDGSPPNISPRTWLNMGLSSTERGSARQLVQQWRASGRRGWNTVIYGT